MCAAPGNLVPHEVTSPTGPPGPAWLSPRGQTCKHASRAGVTRVILYRHFDSKTELYQAVLDRMCARLDAYVPAPAGGFTDASIDGLLKAAAGSPAGFRLLFKHARREPEFK